MWTRAQGSPVTWPSRAADQQAVCSTSALVCSVCSVTLSTFPQTLGQRRSALKSKQAMPLPSLERTTNHDTMFPATSVASPGTGATHWSDVVCCQISLGREHHQVPEMYISCLIYFLTGVVQLLQSFSCIKNMKAESCSYFPTEPQLLNKDRTLFYKQQCHCCTLEKKKRQSITLPKYF